MPSFVTTTTSRAAQVHVHDPAAPSLRGEGWARWLTRGANFVIDHALLQAGAILAREDQPDEYMVLLPDVGARIEAGTETAEAPAGSLVIVPPGTSRLTALGEGSALRVFSSRCTDLLALAHNAAAYDHGAGEGVAPLVPWPAPPGGWRLRVYDLNQALRAGDKTRIFCCTNLMINVLAPREVPRDVRELSPHAHADFEQGSVALAGRWIHHLRTPWGPDMTRWREDEHVEVGSPSVTVIPPRIVHTSRNIGAGRSWLVDVFAPPRLDFARRGMVRNADDYPPPPEGN